MNFMNFRAFVPILIASLFRSGLRSRLQIESDLIVYYDFMWTLRL